MLTVSYSNPSSGAGDFSSSWTWTAAIALATLVVSTWLVVNHRRRDRAIRWHQPDYDTANNALLVLNRLLLTTAVEGVTFELRELVDVISRLRIAEQRSPDLLFGVIAAHLGDYQACALPKNYADRLAADGSLQNDYFALVRMQGTKLEAARSAIVQVQRRIEKQTRN